MAAVVAQAAVARQAVNTQNRAVVQKEIDELFDKLDKDGDRAIDWMEAKEGLESLLDQCNVPPKKLRVAWKAFSSPGSKTLNLKQFGDMVMDLRENPSKYTGEPKVKPHEKSCLGKDKDGKTKKLPYQDQVFYIYNNNWVVGFVASIIIANFVINIVEKEIDPDPENLKYGEFWATMDTVFNCIFIVELIANMWSYGGIWRTDFWKSGWNVFDTIIVVVGFLTMVNALGPPMDKLKLMRAFRVFRLFKRIESLNKIIVSLIKSIPGVANAFLVMFIFFCIYAILAVELFRDFGKDGSYYVLTMDGQNISIDAETARGLNVGLEYYGTFMRALYTLFQVMTGESWSEAVARPLLFGYSDSLNTSAIVVGIFFVSFIIFMQLVLINVVVAVLLDKFVASAPEENNAPLVDESGSLNVSGELSAPAAGAPAAAGAALPAAATLPPPAVGLGKPVAMSKGGEAKLDELLKQMTAMASAMAALKTDLASVKEQVDKMPKAEIKQTI